MAASCRIMQAPSAATAWGQKSVAAGNHQQSSQLWQMQSCAPDHTLDEHTELPAESASLQLQPTQGPYVRGSLFAAFDKFDTQNPDKSKSTVG
jgi:hypothetical protein